MPEPVRRPRPCKACKQRHHACLDEGPDSTGPCLGCSRAGLVCDVQKGDTRPTKSRLFAEKEAPGRNVHAELRAQSKRLSSILDSWADEPEYEVKKPPSADDLVERLTALCFADQGARRPPSNTLVKDAYAAISPSDPLDDFTLSSGGFCFAAESSKKSLAALIASLPPWPDVEQILLNWPRSWLLRVDALHLPHWPRTIENLYLSHFSPAPHPHLIGELFSFLALNQAGLASAIATASPEQSKVHQIEADRLVNLAFAALTLDGDYFDMEPTIQGIRTLQQIAVTYIGAWPDSARMARGAAILPFAGSLILQMGLWKPDETFEYEDDAERWQRKLLVQAVARMVWLTDPYSKAKKCLTTSLLEIEPPEMLDERLIPHDGKYDAWIPSENTFKGLQLQTQCALCSSKVLWMLNRGSARQHLHLREISDRLHALEPMLPETWLIEEDPRTGEFHLPPALDFDDRCARMLALPVYYHQHLVLHRRFLMSKGDVENVDWHRREIITAARKQYTPLADARSIIGGFISIYCALWDQTTVCALLLSPAHAPYLSPIEMLHCQRVVKVALERFKHYSFPDAYFRLSRMTSFVMSRFVNHVEAPKPVKRSKTARQGVVGLPDAVTRPDSQTSTSGSSSGSSSSSDWPPRHGFTFSVTTPPGIELATLDDHELRHIERAYGTPVA